VCYNGGMVDEPENLTLKQLALLRSEVQEGFASLRADLATLTETVRTLARSDVTIQRGMAAMQRDMVVLKDRMTILTVAGDEHPPAHV
jgi:hypothetical protein